MGDRDAFGLKVGAAGAVVEVFVMRRGRVCDRIELVSETPGEAPRVPAVPGEDDARIVLGGRSAAVLRGPSGAAGSPRAARSRSG